MTNPIPKPIRDIEKLDPKYKTKLKRFLKHLDSIGIPMNAHETLRTAERQQYLIATGKSKVKRSNHQDGLASDLHFVHAPHFPTNADPWRKVAEIAKTFGIDNGGLMWNGWDWNHFQDDGSPLQPLFELADWQKTAIDWAKSNKVSNGERPSEPITRVETMEMLRKFEQHMIRHQ